MGHLAYGTFLISSWRTGAFKLEAFKNTLISLPYHLNLSIFCWRKLYQGLIVPQELLGVLRNCVCLRLHEVAGEQCFYPVHCMQMPQRPSEGFLIILKLGTRICLHLTLRDPSNDAFFDSSGWALQFLESLVKTSKSRN